MPPSSSVIRYPKERRYATKAVCRPQPFTNETWVSSADTPSTRTAGLQVHVNEAPAPLRHQGPDIQTLIKDFTHQKPENMRNIDTLLVTRKLKSIWLETVQSDTELQKQPKPFQQ